MTGLKIIALSTAVSFFTPHPESKVLVGADSIQQGQGLICTGALPQEEVPPDAGEIYSPGVEVQADGDEDGPTLERALATNDGIAPIAFARFEYELAQLYRDTDPGMTAVWLERAARSGHVVAARELADMYSSGRGCHRDESLAQYWRELATQTQDEDAVTRFAHMMSAGPRLDGAEPTIGLEWYVTRLRQLRRDDTRED